jgi:hypothetical protein
MLDPTSSPRERKELNSSRSVYFHADLVSPSSDDIVNTAYNKPNADRDNRDNDSDVLLPSISRAIYLQQSVQASSLDQPSNLHLGAGEYPGPSEFVETSKTRNRRI